MEGGQERVEKSAQKILAVVQEAEELPEIEAGGREQGVATVAGAAFQPVAAEQSVVFGVADDRFDDRAALQPTFDLVGDAAFRVEIFNLFIPPFFANRYGSSNPIL